MGWIFMYKAMLFSGFVLCCLIAWRLYIKDGAKPVVEEMAIWKLVTLRGAHSGTVFVALAAACFIVMVTTKSSYTSPDGDHVALLADEDWAYGEMAEMDEYEEYPTVEMGQYLPPEEYMTPHEPRRLIMKDDD